MRGAAVDVEGQNDLATVKTSIKKSRDLSGKRFRSFVIFCLLTASYKMFQCFGVDAGRI